MKVEQLGQLFERGSNHRLQNELYWIDSNGMTWQIAGHGIGKEECVPQLVFWIPPDAKPVHHADPHLKKTLKRIRFFEWFKENQAKNYYKTKHAKLFSVNDSGHVWQHAAAGLQRSFWLPENVRPLMA